MPTEKELKYSIPDRASLEKLVSHFQSAFPAVRQTNHYFLGNTRGPLARGHAMLRLRAERKRWILTFKSGLVVESGCFTSAETEAEVGTAEARRMMREGIKPSASSPGPIKAAAGIDRSRTFKVAGASVTRRVKAPIPTGDFIEIDSCDFPGGARDFEAEIETRRPAKARRCIEALFRELGIRVIPQTRTKYERFLSAVRSHRAAGKDGMGTVDRMKRPKSKV